MGDSGLFAPRDKRMETLGALLENGLDLKRPWLFGTPPHRVSGDRFRHNVEIRLKIGAEK